MESGTKLGHYEISTLLGKGGMGEVWRARDTKLGREVAIKTLPEEFAQDADRLARFEREAKLLASLNHPNIAAIHGFEEHNGTHFLVLELVEGDTLADRIGRGAIPIEESLKIALQIADALKAAHDKGVIHRDLKPLNIKVTDDDTVKVLDFGLAKAFAGDEAEASVSNSPTLSMAATQQGMILGTAAYMSPEQAKGRGVDKRTDIFAFGCVLYEMLTGHQSFGKSDVAESLSAVISLQPEWTALPENLHSRLRETVERCLEKRLAKRFQDIGDVSADIEKVMADPSGVLVQPVAAVNPATPQSKLPWVVGAFLFGALLTFVASIDFSPELNDSSVRRYEIRPPADVRLGGGGGGNYLAFAPDGNTLVYMGIGVNGSGRQAYVHRLDSFESYALEGTDDLAHPFFSPDGRWIGFFAGNELKRISVDGGPALKIADLESPQRGATWLPDETIIFGQVVGGLMRVSASAGNPEPLTTPTGDETAHRWPEVLRDGTGLLYTSVRGDQTLSEMRIAVLDLRSNETRIVLDESGTSPRYSPTGHLLFSRENVLMAAPFSLETLSVGESFPEPILDGISARNRGATDFTISPTGSLAYIESNIIGAGRQELRFVDIDGNEELFVGGLQGARRFGSMRISPDGDQIAATVIDGEDSDVWLYDLGSATPSQFTSDGRSGNPVWSPDGVWIAFATLNDDGGTTISRMRVDGSGVAEPILADGRSALPMSWSPISEHIAIVTGIRFERNIEVLSLGEGTTELLTANDNVADINPRFSPDGDWIAYESNESGQYEIYVRPYGRPGNSTLVSTSGGTKPMWSPDGAKLFFWVNQQILMAAEIETEPSFRRRSVDVQFQLPFFPSAADVHPDGSRLIANSAGAGLILDEQDNVKVVLNWFEELKERVPVP